jgi:hypothetical protein
MNLDAAVAAETEWMARYDGFACEGSVVDADEPLMQVLSRAYARVAHFALEWCGDTSSGGALAHAGRGGEKDGHR